MDVVFRIEGLDEPSGEVDLLRLEQFVIAFRSGILRSAQAALNVPAHRRALEGEEVPRFRLADIGEGSTALVLRSVDERPVTVQSVQRHVEALTDYLSGRGWPAYMYPGERQAWGHAYRALMANEGAQVTVRLNGLEAKVDEGVVNALESAPVLPELQEVVVIGDLHLIDVGGSPHFNIHSPETDLRFDLHPGIRETVDAHRWHRVRARARWEVGSNRAGLIGDIERSVEAAGIQVIGDVALPEWVPSQLERLERFRELRAGWLDAESNALSPRRIKAAEELSRQIIRTFGDRVVAKGPFFVPTGEGTVEFEWTHGNRELICEVGLGRFSILTNEDGRDIFEGDVDQRGLFGWIDWLLGGEQPNA